MALRTCTNQGLPALQHRALQLWRSWPCSIRHCRVQQGSPGSWWCVPAPRRALHTGAAGSPPAEEHTSGVSTCCIALRWHAAEALLAGASAGSTQGFWTPAAMRSHHTAGLPDRAAAVLGASKDRPGMPILWCTLLPAPMRSCLLVTRVTSKHARRIWDASHDGQPAAVLATYSSSRAAAAS